VARLELGHDQPDHRREKRDESCEETASYDQDGVLKAVDSVALVIDSLAQLSQVLTDLVSEFVEA
jgi:hypothetical protein